MKYLRLQKVVYWVTVLAASGMTAWLGSAITMWLVRQFSMVE